MHLLFDTNIASQYKSTSQKIRVMSEKWLVNNIYCPHCGHEPITEFANNNPVGDFFCTNCDEQFELKSKNAKTIGANIADGAYESMLARIQSQQNPNFFFLMYNKLDFSVHQLIIVPKHFFTPTLIIPRKKGIPNRPNYIMCSINIGLLPEQGKIKIIDNKQFTPKSTVTNQWQRFKYLADQENLVSRGWSLEILKLVNKMPNDIFTLKQCYEFESDLAMKFPNNRHIKEKIRQQLQILRDKNIIEFIKPGIYRKMS